MPSEVRILLSPLCECSSMVEPQPSKLVMSVRSRSLARDAYVAQSVERFLGKEEVTGSNPVVGSPNSKEKKKYELRSF